MTHIGIISLSIIVLLFLIYSIFPTVIIRVCRLGITNKNKRNTGIALTFDDGPNPEYTTQLLDLLKKYEIKGSFFVVGSKVKNNPDIIKRMHEEGHTIGIHHFDHISSWILSPFQLSKQLSMTEKAIMECTHEKVTFYRPPWGHFNIFTKIASKKYKVIMWSDIFGDWKVETCRNDLLNQLRTTSTENSILLLHDCGETLGADKEAPRYMIEVLEIYLEETIKKGTQFITLKDL
ncbi:peptidoglycan/xylan/chitin deacetylase (PgdA/CDA1 family) [Peribacillus simplex]|uniref:polysaccharide deacetylase family protein n=1 Tax=Peribacillus TaxID=2675229 RepID=UPI0024E21F99|nr:MULTISPECIES: polysaccharide deacetylase family protein [Peribacillus]MDF9759312.1 peptidoglycan/xylan/chitin deacetylase (PgdA/CDA1 family) [Peribacillus simplex]MDV7764912.1 polysaccharide deacetylase family protein [Peribacillus sp. CSMR9]